MFFRKKKPAAQTHGSPAPYFLRLRDAILQEALRHGASVIRIEPAEGETAVHFLSDEKKVLTTFPARLHRRVVEAFRAGAGITDASEMQFAIGLMLLEHADAQIDAYAVLFPTPHGVRVTVRLVPKTDPPVAVTPWELLQI